MAAAGPGDPTSQHVRTALEWMRVLAAGVCLLLVAFLVLDRRSGGFEYVIALLGAMGVFLGMPALAKLIRKE
jgi:uncharacterized YccA/Bax inhibitor family protein